LNEVERPLTEEEKAELDELMYRFHPLGSLYKSVGRSRGESRQLELQKKAAAPQ
jgi:hypothetical protein